MTLGSSLETLDLLTSSASEINPEEGEAIAGLVKGSVIQRFALTAQDKAFTSGSWDQHISLASSSAVRSRAP